LQLGFNDRIVVGQMLGDTEGLLVMVSDGTELEIMLGYSVCITVGNVDIVLLGNAVLVGSIVGLSIVGLLEGSSVAG
jgi:hypothetical protein